MVKKRAPRELEREIMTYMWAAEAPATPGQAHQAVAPELAYTTVMTVFVRLWEKGRLNRAAAGRGYVYWPSQTEAAHRAEQMQTTLDSCTDRLAVLSRFVDALGPDDADELRRLLESEADR